MKKAIFGLCIILMVNLILIACAGGTENPGGGVNDISNEEMNSAGDTEVTSKLELELPSLNFDGEEIHFLLVKGGLDYYTSYEIYAADLNGGLLNDAVYNRNLIIEELLNIKITGDWSASANSVASKSLMAGETLYDVVMPYMNQTITLAQQGLLKDLFTLKYIDLEKPWWDQRANENLAVNGKLFITTGDLCILDKECTMVMFFNKVMIADYNLDNPYQLVADNKWTIDKVFQIGAVVTEDINGDGKLNNSDKWGLSIAGNAPHSMFFGSGERIAKNVDGELQIVMYNPRSVNVIASIFDHLEDPMIFTNRVGDTGYNTVNKMFNERRVMIVTFALVDINGLRDAEFEFGILPYPLYEETQDSYNNLISTSLVSSVSVPYNCKEPDMVSAALEALAYYSGDTLKAAYYDNALKTRYARDDESGDMLDIIFDTRVYDMGYIYNWGGIGTLIESMYASKKNTFASEYEKVREKALTAMQKTIDEFMAIK